MRRRAGRPRRPDPAASLLTWVVDPLSPLVREEVGAVREAALAVHGEVPVEVVLTGDDPRSPAVRAAVIALLAAGDVHPVRVVEDVVRAHADRGLDVSDPDVVGTLARQRGQDADAVSILATSATADEMAAEDRELARALGDPEHHALLLWQGAVVHRLPLPHGSPREVVEAIRSLRRGR